MYSVSLSTLQQRDDETESRWRVDSSDSNDQPYDVRERGVMCMIFHFHLKNPASLSTCFIWKKPYRYFYSDGDDFFYCTYDYDYFLYCFFVCFSSQSLSSRVLIREKCVHEKDRDSRQSTWAILSILLSFVGSNDFLFFSLPLHDNDDDGRRHSLEKSSQENKSVHLHHNVCMLALPFISAPETNSWKIHIQTALILPRYLLKWCSSVFIPVYVYEIKREKVYVSVKIWLQQETWTLVVESNPEIFRLISHSHGKCVYFLMIVVVMNSQWEQSSQEKKTVLNNFEAAFPSFSCSSLNRSFNSLSLLLVHIFQSMHAM